MPLTDKDANTAAASSTATTTRKRGLDAFLQPITAGQLAGPPKSPNSVPNRAIGSNKENLAASSPPVRSPGLTESGSSPLDRDSPTPNTPTKHSSSPTLSLPKDATSTASAAASGEPPKKRKRASQAEMKERQEEQEKKKREKEEAEKLKAEEQEKKKREKEEADKLKAEEQEKKKREKEEADKLKAEEKEKKRLEKEEADKVKAAKAEEIKKKKEERERKKREKEEEAAKKARSQLTLTGMFGKAITSHHKPQSAAKNDAAKPDASGKETSKDKDAPACLYDQIFKPFFIKEHVRLAPNPCELDDEAREYKTRVLDEYIEGKRTMTVDRFDPVEALQIPFKPKRGRVYPSVKKIMAEFTSESQTPQGHSLRELLKSVPVKSLKFSQDVRPPYIGTISGLPPGVKSLRKIARNPFSRDVLPLAYDYDSEAEWQDDEGEDVDDLDEEEEELDGDEDMDDFLDDAEDTGPSRMVFSGGMEPESTGLCWENRKRLTSELKMCKYRMEFIHDKLEHHHSIDPFSTVYWECPKAKSEAAKISSPPPPNDSGAGAKGGSADQSAKSMAPPSAPADAFQALSSGPASRPKKSQQLLPAEYQEKLKDLVRAKPTLSKVGVIELFVAEHPSLVKGQVKNSFDALIVKNGKEHKVKGD